MFTPIIITSFTDWMRVKPAVQAVRRNHIQPGNYSNGKSGWLLCKVIPVLTQKGNPI